MKTEISWEIRSDEGVYDATDEADARWMFDYWSNNKIVDNPRLFRIEREIIKEEDVTPK